jgi:hypothetical protein
MTTVIRLTDQPEKAMPTRSNADERNKFDHSDHSLDRREPGDLRAPSGGKAETLNDLGQSDPRDRGSGRSAPLQSLATSGRKNSRLRRLDSRNPSSK